MKQNDDAAAARPVVPLKVNVFEHVRVANTQLAPLFPYLHPGAIVPCSSGFAGEAGTNIGYFIHENSVDEVGLVMGASGRMRTGEVWRGPRKHGVGFSAEHPFFSVSVITQRQAEEGEQSEAVTFLCEKCSEVLARHEFSGAHADGEDTAVPPLPTTVGSLAAARLLEDDPARRRCATCGHESAAFPLDVWGWHRYVGNTRIADRAQKVHQEASS